MGEGPRSPQGRNEHPGPLLSVDVVAAKLVADASVVLDVVSAELELVPPDPGSPVDVSTIGVLAEQPNDSNKPVSHPCRTSEY